MNFLSAENQIMQGTAKERRWICVSAGIAVLLVGLDQITKALVVNRIPFHSCIAVIPGFFDLTYLTNKGAAWGVFHSLPWIPFAISVIAFFLLLFFLRKLSAGWPERYLSLFLVISGIIGNSADRISRGAVVDFLRFHWQNRVEWPSFNVADSAICCGVILFLLSSFFRPEDKKKESCHDADPSSDPA